MTLNLKNLFSNTVVILTAAEVFDYVRVRMYVRIVLVARWF